MESSPDNSRVLGIEKRLVDVELALNDINKKLGSIASPDVSDVKQRMEDLEDVVLIDNAGVIELQRMLESAKQPEQPVQQAPDELRGKVEQLETELNALKQATPAAAGLSIDEMRTYVDSKLSNLPKTPQTDDAKEEVMILKSRLAAVEKSITQPQKEQLSEPMLNELQSLREEILAAKSDIASTESLTQQLSAKLEQMKASPTQLKVDIDDATLSSRLSVMDKMVQDNNRKIALVQSDMQRLRTQPAQEPSSQLKDAVTALNQQIADLRKRMESNRIFLMDTFKDELRQAMSKSDPAQMYANVNKMVDGKLAKFDAAFNEKMKNVARSVEDMMKGPDMIDEQMIELVNRTLYLETRLSALEKTLKEFKQTTMPIIIE